MLELRGRLELNLLSGDYRMELNEEEMLVVENTRKALDAFIQENTLEETIDEYELNQITTKIMYSSNRVSVMNSLNSIELNLLKDSVVLVSLINRNNLEGITLNDELAKLFNLLVKDVVTENYYRNGVDLSFIKYWGLGNYELDENNTVIGCTWDMISSYVK